MTTSVSRNPPTDNVGISPRLAKFQEAPSSCTSGRNSTSNTRPYPGRCLARTVPICGYGVLRQTKLTPGLRALRDVPPKLRKAFEQRAEGQDVLDPLCVCPLVGAVLDSNG